MAGPPSSDGAHDEKRADARERPDHRLCRTSQPGPSQRDDIVSLLLGAYLFRDLNPAELQPLAARCTIHDYARGARVFALGDPATALYVVVKGAIKDCLVTAAGAEAIFEVISSGGVFGEPGLFSVERDRIVDCIAIEPSRVVIIPREALVEFLFIHPPAMSRMLEGLASELRRYALLVADVAYQRIRDRVAAKLLELAMTHGSFDGPRVRLQLTLSQGLLAGMVEATRENVNRALAELSDAGAVTIARGEYVVDPRRLRAFATEYALGHRRNRAPRSTL